MTTLCNNLLQTEIGEPARYFLGRFMMGLSESGIDIQTVLKKELIENRSNFAPGFLQKVKFQSVKERLGDVIQLLSRTTVHASVIIVSVAATAIIIEAGVTAATGTLGAIAAKNLFEPLALSINPDGTAAIAQAASSGGSVWQAIATSIGQAAQAVYGVLEQTGNFFAAIGDGRQKPPSTPIGRRGQPLNCSGSNSAKIINGRVFTGHALDRMQGRGITPSIVESVIKNGVALAGKTPSTTAYTFKNVKVIINNQVML